MKPSPLVAVFLGGVAAAAAYFVACGGTHAAGADTPQTFTGACQPYKDTDGSDRGSLAIINVPGLGAAPTAIVTTFLCDFPAGKLSPCASGSAERCAPDLVVHTPEQCSQIEPQIKRRDGDRYIVECQSGAATVQIRVQF